MKVSKKLGLSVATLSMVILLGACGKTDEKSGEVVGESGSATVYTDDSGDDVVVGEDTLKDDGYFKDIVTKDIDPRVKDKISYDTDYENKDWDHVDFKVDHAKFVTVDHYKDKDGTPYKTLVSLHYKLENEDSTDKDISPDGAELVMKDGERVKAETFMDVWDDEVLTSDAHKDGYIHFKVKDEKKLEEIKAIDVTFKAKNDDDKDVTHTYDIEMPINAEG